MGKTAWIVPFEPGSTPSHTMDTLVRRAVSQDAEAVSAVHIRTWQVAYRGQLPAEYLDQLGQNRDQRIAFWQAEIATPPPQHEVWVVGPETGGPEDQVHGFLSIGPTRDDDPKTTGELYAIYVDPGHWDQGLGRALFRKATERFAALGFKSATLWVLESNARARRFYEIAGWIADGGTKIEARPAGVELHEVRYRFELRQEREES